jgi:hypothetical protein
MRKKSFSLGAVLYVLRLALKWHVVLNGWPVPMWGSNPAAAPQLTRVRVPSQVLLPVCGGRLPRTVRCSTESIFPQRTKKTSHHTLTTFARRLESSVQNRITSSNPNQTPFL